MGLPPLADLLAQALAATCQAAACPGGSQRPQAGPRRPLLGNADRPPALPRNRPPWAILQCRARRPPVPGGCQRPQAGPRRPLLGNADRPPALGHSRGPGLHHSEWGQQPGPGPGQAAACWPWGWAPGLPPLAEALARQSGKLIDQFPKLVVLGIDNVISFIILVTS